jgi:hypothetical protein
MADDKAVKLKKWTGVKETDLFVDLIHPKGGEEDIQLVFKSGSGRIQARIAQLSLSDGLVLIEQDEESSKNLPEGFIDGAGYVRIAKGELT